MIEKRVYTVPEFCEAYRISRSYYYKLRKEGKTPPEMKLLSKVLISKESAAKWFKENYD